VSGGTALIGAPQCRSIRMPAREPRTCSELAARRPKRRPGPSLSARS
jgi:hypothetical protein